MWFVCMGNEINKKINIPENFEISMYKIIYYIQYFSPKT